MSWVRPTVLGCSPQALGIEPGDDVCYVLPFRSTADLMVIDAACERAGLPRPYLPLPSGRESRAFFFLGRPEGRLGRRSRRMQSARMQRLFDHQEAGGRPIRIVPVSLFWGHQPDQEKSWFKLLLSDNWSATSRMKKLLAIVFHPGHLLVEFGAPISVAELVSEQADRELQVRKLMRILRVHFNHQKQAILGPDLSHRRTLISSIMEAPAVREAIERETASGKSRAGAIEKKALGYANEIVSDQSYRVIRFFHVLLTWLWNKLYDGIDVHNIDSVKDLARSHEIVYTPCHRSHIDYLLLSYVLYHNGLTPPHIAAGRNLNLPVAGPLLRRAGAFFMRRTFQGDPLYKSIFDEYLHLMFTRGYSVEYFIEGGRSRTGRTLNPRTGMLSMTMRSFLRDATRPMAMLPVYISYERIIEASTYMGELGGKDKKQESILDIFKIFGVFRHRFGRVEVSFGEPVTMGEFLDETLPGWKTPASVDNAAFSVACDALARRLATHINAAAIVNPVNLVATALLSTPRQTMEESRLKHQVEVLRQVAACVPNTITTSLTPDEIVAEAEQITGIERRARPFGDILYAPADISVLLTWYRNNTAHIFALSSTIARVVRSDTRSTTESVITTCRTLYPYLRGEFFLRWDADEIGPRCEAHLALLESVGLIAQKDNAFVMAETATEEFAALLDLSEIVMPTLERFYIVATLLSEGRHVAVKELESDAAAIGEQLSSLFGINSPEFFDRSLFTAFIATLKSQGVIRSIDNRIVLGDGFTALMAALDETLDPHVRYNVQHIAARLRRDKDVEPAGATLGTEHG
ncbi:MAG: glycerol-3-phosphate 1-O-acyltransferase PlsB [Pseudomonadales bacterium]|nr:glycerol-3-phosphate 1-O-acyltransferase PlsB [Pseudomonadales bacterium]